MPKFVVYGATLENPRWPATLTPGTAAKMEVDAPQIQSSQFIEFRIHHGDHLIDTVIGADGANNANWTVPNLPHNPRVTFDALLKQKATAQAGFLGVLAKATSPDKEVQGFKVEIESVDAAFAPHTEKLNVKYKITDPGNVLAGGKGRYEIWGERYPENAPLYTAHFDNPATTTWADWDGKANAGTSNNLYISPEFSPYRVRVIVGLNQSAVDDAFGAGISQVAIAEAPFEVVFESVNIRLQAGITEAASAGLATAQYTLAEALAIEPFAAAGNYAAMGRLPKTGEVCRVRIPMARHQLSADALDQGGLDLGGNYLSSIYSNTSVVAVNVSDGGHGYASSQNGAAVTFSPSPTGDTATGTIVVAGGKVTSINVTHGGSGYAKVPTVTLPTPANGPFAGEASVNRVNRVTSAGQTKWTIDSQYYTRPQIPIEFELRLRSRVDANNTDPTKLGIAEKEAVGPAKIEPYAEDVYLPAIYDGTSKDQTYWRKAACKIKKGAHNAPANSGATGIAAAGVAANSPVFHCWQYRREVTTDGTTDFNLDGFDANDQTYRYQPTQNELTVFLNRAKLTLGANQAALDKAWADYIEVDNHTIKLRANLTKTGDVLWVLRKAATGDASWSYYPPGTNCHKLYGGIRGADPSNGLFTNAYATPAGAFEPVIGKTTGAYAYAGAFINTRPDSAVAQLRQERVEISAVVATGAQQGLAGVLFSPSCIAGDSYAIHALVEAAPYERNLGWIDAKPVLDGKTGTVQVWRVITISKSVRLPDRALGSITSVTITNGGTGYDQDDVGKAVTFSAPPSGGTTATGTVASVAGGAVTGITITNRGSGYTGPATVTIPHSGTAGISGFLLRTRAVGTANVRTSGVTSVRLLTGGSGYDNTHVGLDVTFAPPGGNGATAKGKIGEVTAGAVTAITVTSQGSGYTAAPAVTVPPPTRPAKATLTIAGTRITAVNITDKGYGYEPAQANAAVTFPAPTGPNPIQATGQISVITNRAVAAIRIINAGRGYTGTVAVTIPAPAAPGVAATATGNIGGAVGADVGCPPDPTPIVRAHIGDGVSMSMSDLNARLTTAFNEWRMPPPDADAPAFDVHKDADLTAYRNVYNALPLGPGKIPMTNGDWEVTNNLVPYDHYRVRLPPNTPYVNAASNTIAKLAPGTRSEDAMNAVQSATGGFRLNDDTLTAPFAIPISPLGAQAYGSWVLGVIRTHRGTLLSALTPANATQPKTMQVVRWPGIHDSPIWNDGASPMGTAGLTILGTSLGDALSIFVTGRPDSTTFPHEMGHSCNLVHFVSGNFAWKHHNLLQPDCLMSYDFPTGFIVKPGTTGLPVTPTAAVGPNGGAADTGWPNTVPATLPSDSNIYTPASPPTVPAGSRCIQLDAIPPHPAPNRHCAKCILKLRGWKEDLLPCAWNHPDLF